MENPILKDDLIIHWRIEEHGSKLAWRVNILDKTHIWRRTGVRETKEECEEMIKDCIDNFEKIY